MMLFPLSLLLALVAQVLARWRDPDGFEHGQDLLHFITRPDITAPRYVVAKHHPEAIADGYWFVAPYAALNTQPDFNGRKEHVSCQTGAHIYDADGNLVWSGACLYENRNVFGFRPVDIDGEQFLSFHLDGEDLGDGTNQKSAKILLNSHYEEISRIDETPRGSLDMHEFNILKEGKTALVAANWWQGYDELDIEGGERTIVNCGFEEVNMTSGETLFKWDALSNGIALSESYDRTGLSEADHAWDFLHCNSFDKDSEGNYYVSGRHASTIYKVSGEDGHVIWRLGGMRSDFSLAQGVPFHWQHHVRVRSVNATHTILTVFDNAAEDEHRNDDMTRYVSAAKIISMDMNTMEASILRRFDRPDDGSSEKLGSVQTIGDDIETSHVFVDWAYQGYISEYDTTQLVLEAKFQSDRFSSYRAYKFPFVGKPNDKPLCKILPMAISTGGYNVASAFYASWNGATEVATWSFYGAPTAEGPFEKLATVTRNGFETAWVMPGYVQYGYAEAVDANGLPLGESEVASFVPAQDGDFQVPPPFPTGIDLERQRPSGEHAADEQSVPDAFREAAQSAQQQTSSSIDSIILSNIWSLFLYALALLGIYSLALRVFPALDRWRKGYETVKSSPTLA